MNTRMSKKYTGILPSWMRSNGIKLPTEHGDGTYIPKGLSDPLLEWKFKCGWCGMDFEKEPWAAKSQPEILCLMCYRYVKKIPYRRDANFLGGHNSCPWCRVNFFEYPEAVSLQPKILCKFCYESNDTPKDDWAKPNLRGIKNERDN